MLGLVLLVVTKIDLAQFSANAITAQTMLGREMPIAALGLLASVLVLFSSAYWSVKKQWKKAIQAVVAPILFFVCFSLGGLFGGVYFSAT